MGPLALAVLEERAGQKCGQAVALADCSHCHFIKFCGAHAALQDCPLLAGLLSPGIHVCRPPHSHVHAIVIVNQVGFWREL